jgi:DNA-binding CsgD family transcriptional regulator
MIYSSLGRYSMDQYHVFRIACLVAAVPAVAALVAALAKRKSRGSIFLQGELICAVCILILNFFEISSREPERILLLSHATYALIAFVPVTWFLFALQFGLGRDADLRRVGALASAVPSITTVLAFLGDRTDAIWKSYEIRDFGGLSAIVVTDYGPWFYIHVCYSYGMFIAGAVFVFWQFIGHYEVYRRQAALIIAATGLPLIPNAAYVLRLIPGQTKDFSSIAIAITGVLFTISVVKYRLLDLRPAPRERIVDYLDERVLIVDEKRRIVHCNKQASADFAGPAGESLIGRAIQDVFPSLLPEAFDSAEKTRVPATFECLGSDGISRVLMTVKTIDPGSDGLPRFCVVARQASADAPSLIDVVFTKREVEISSMIALGMSTKEIAARLYISENTTKTHIRHIYKKTGTSDRHELRRIVAYYRGDPGASG